MFLKNSDLFNIFCDNIKCQKKFIEISISYLIERKLLSAKKLSNILEKELEKLFKNFDGKWILSGKNKSKFEKKYHDFLNENFSFEFQYSKHESNDDSGKKRGRPELPFEEKGPRAKRLAVSNLCKSVSNDPQILLTATLRAAHISGNADLADVMKKIISSPGSTIQQLKCPSDVRKKTLAEGLSYMLDNNLSVNQYNATREECIESGAEIFPPYYKLLEYRKSIRPKNIKINELSANVPLQDLVENTISRLVEVHKELFISKIISRNKISELVWIIFNWGFDGSTGQSQYNQKIIVNDNYVESSLFATTVTPLKVVTEDNDCYWVNLVPHSTRFVRPKEIRYIKESKHVALETKAKFEKEIESLIPFRVKLSDQNELLFNYIFLLTAIDGKILSNITHTGYQTCPFCKSTPTEMSEESNFYNNKFNIDDSSCQYGISHLHAWIRSFECILHISYRFVRSKSCNFFGK
jgi:hypothetical protein